MWVWEHRRDQEWPVCVVRYAKKTCEVRPCHHTESIGVKKGERGLSAGREENLLARRSRWELGGCPLLLIRGALPLVPPNGDGENRVNSQ